MQNVLGVTRFLGLGVLLFVLASCTTSYRNHGYVPISQNLAEIRVGKDTKETVAQTIGQPSASGIVDDGGWYYVQSRFRHYAFRKPVSIDRQVVAISFNNRGVVSNIEHFGLEDGQIVTLSRRVTNSSVGEISFLRQLMGNVGQPDPSAFLGN